MWYCKNCQDPTTNMGNHMCSKCKSTNIVEVVEKKQDSSYYYCKCCDSYTNVNGQGKCNMCGNPATKMSPYESSQLKVEGWNGNNWVDITSYYYKNGKVVKNLDKAPWYAKVKVTNAYGNWSYFETPSGGVYEDMTDGFGNTINLKKSMDTWKFDSANADKSYYYNGDTLIAIDDKATIVADGKSPTMETSGNSTPVTTTNGTTGESSAGGSSSEWTTGGLFSNTVREFSENVMNSIKAVFKSGEVKEGKEDDWLFGEAFNDATGKKILDYSIYGGAFGVARGSDNGEIQAKLDSIFNDTSGTIKENPLDRNILGLPLCYNSLADPNREVFCNTIMYDAPLIWIVPGKPKMNKKLIDASGDKIIDLDDYYKRVDGSGTDDPRGFGILGPKDSGDLRYLNFSKNYNEYWKYVQFLTSTVHGWIIADDPSTNLIERFDFSDEFKESFQDAGVCFYGDKSTSVSESATNSYTTSKIAEQVNGSQTTTREASLLGEYGTATEVSNAIFSNIAATVKQAGTNLESLKSFEAILTKTANNFIKVVNGAQLDFPEMWSDSTFERSYNLSFRFYSPYGNRMSIFKYVYVPFLALLTFCLPQNLSGQLKLS